MTEEFDKEIDTLLRQAAQSVDTVSKVQDLHLDADQINAFAENALPAKARLRTMEHLADCVRCRKILSDVIAFHSETKSEIVPLIETKTTVAAPWYKRLFIFPQIAYLMGALALIFTGIFAVTVLQNSSDRNASQIAQVEEKSFNDAGPSAESLDRIESSNAASNAAMPSNTSAGLRAANSNVSAPPAEVSRNKETSSESSATPAPGAPTDRTVTDKAAMPAPKPTIPLNEETETAKKEKAVSPSPVAAAPPASSRENNYAVDGTADSVSKQQAEQQPVQNSITQNQTTMMPDSRNARNVQNLPMNGRNTQSMEMKSRAEASGGSRAANKDDDDRKTETRTVSGKNFRRADGVWYDVKYKGQKTTNVSRNSSDYKKLDGGLRSIADNLGGVVVIVWKDKAYRIQ